jgi:subtilisin family serine protease
LKIYIYIYITLYTYIIIIQGFIGVAPNAIVNVWRVFGCDGGTSSDIIMKAMLEAEKAKCDVINMSLGNDAPWAEQPHAALAQKFATQGISGNYVH